MNRTPSERASIGKAARSRASRSGQADWAPGKRRPDPEKTLAGQDASRVRELVPVRYGRMLVSPFTFYRGAAAIMAADLAASPDSGLSVQLCGDAHLSNFGVFEAPDRSLVFDINDFDETLPGPFEWDLKRLVASFAVAGRQRGFSRKQRRTIELTVTRQYREAMQQLAAMRNLEVWYARFDVEGVMRGLRGQVPARDTRKAERNLSKARSKDSLRAVRKLTETVDGQLRIVSRPPLLTPVEEVAEGRRLQAIETAMRGFLAQYRRTLSPDRRMLVNDYEYVHAARKVVGVGSVGTRAWIVLLMGRDGDDPLFLQAKEAQASVLEPFAGKSRFGHHGRRVVEGQRLTQAASDVLLGWISAEGIERGGKRDFYVRQLWDGKGSADIDTMAPGVMEIYARMCGWTLARAHARSGDRIAITSYLGKGTRFDEAIADFSEAYADQNESDYGALQAAAKAKRVKVEAGV